MAPEKKRKLPSGEPEKLGDEILEGLLDGVLSESDDDLEPSSNDAEASLDDNDSAESESEEDEEDDEDAWHSDDVPSDLDEDSVLKNLSITNGAPDGGDEDTPNFVVTKDADGGVRYEYPEIDPIYDSDDSDAQEGVNTIGNIPLSFYDSYPHIGYDIHGKKVMRPATGEALDALLDSIEIPRGWTGLTDPETGKPLNLTPEELKILRQVQTNELPEDYDPYPDLVEYFSSIEEKMPLSAAPEPKRRFLPSKHEAVRVMKLVRAIREGRIQPYKPPEERDDEEEEEELFDIWRDETPREANVMNIAAPKLPPPSHDQSYHAPAEYLPTADERKTWEDADPEEREKEYLPESYNSLRLVPAYSRFVNERFERSLDLYLAPRVRRNRLNIDPASLLPKLPRPEELKPFPTVAQTVFRGHQGWVRSVHCDPAGYFIASGGEDSTVRVWELLTGRQVWSVKISSDEPVHSVRWRPTKDTFILAAAAGEDIFLMVPPLCDPELEKSSRDILDAGFGYASNGVTQGTATKKQQPGKWARPGAELIDEGVLVRVTVRSTVRSMSWHRRGDHLCTVSPSGHSGSVVIHTLSRHLSQAPFRKRSNIPQAAHFHPTQPVLFLASKQAIRAYDLRKSELIKTLQPGARLISSFDVHPSGDHLVVGSYDRRLLWHDLELSNRPYRTMRFHEKAIRAVQFSRPFPLFADASDDGSVQIFHSTVYNDITQSPTIVPLKTLKGHNVVDQVGVMDIDWHPRQPWVITAGSDGTCRLWM